MSFRSETAAKWVEHTNTHFSNHSGCQNVNKPVARCNISRNKFLSVWADRNVPSGSVKLDSVTLGLRCLWGCQRRSLACADWLTPLWREVTWQSAQLAIWSPTATVTKWSPTGSGQWGNQRSLFTQTCSKRLHKPSKKSRDTAHKRQSNEGPASTNMQSFMQLQEEKNDGLLRHLPWRQIHHFWIATTRSEKNT